VRALLRARNAAYRTGDKLAYSNARREPRMGIKEVKNRSLFSVQSAILKTTTSAARGEV